jgi:hypothetical protein
MTHDKAYPVATKSAAVTVLAVSNFILGGARLILSALMLYFAVVLLVGGSELAGKQDGSGWAFLGQLLGVFMLMAGVILLVLATAFIVISILLLVAGIGLLRRRPTSRILTLVLGGLGGVLSLLYLIQLVVVLINESPTTQGVVISLVGLVVHGGYCALAFMVLLNRRIAAEFSLGSYRRVEREEQDNVS